MQLKYKTFINDTGRTARNDRIGILGYDKKTTADVLKTANKELKELKASIEVKKAKLTKKSDKGLTNTTNSSIINMGSFESLYSKDAADSMQKLLENAPQNVQDAWNKYADQLTRLDKTTYTKDNDSWYKPSGNYIQLNIYFDSRSDSSYLPHETIFHEMGHFIDANAISVSQREIGFSPLYKEGLFYATIKKDYENLLNKYGSTYEINKVINDMSVLSRKDVSDPLYGLSKGAVNGDWRHQPSYYDRYSTPSEVFAEMFGASIANPESIESLKTWFPDSYIVFNEILDEITK